MFELTALCVALAALAVSLYAAVGIRYHLKRLAWAIRTEAATERCPAPDDWEAIEHSSVRVRNDTPIPEATAIGQDYQPRNCLPPPAPNFWGEDEP